MMQFTEEHQEIPTEDAAVMPVGEPRKQSRARYLPAERHQKKHELTACRKKVSRHARVAWRKRNLFRKTVDRARSWPPLE
jgi:hypothetical protein